MGHGITHVQHVMVGVAAFAYGDLPLVKIHGFRGNSVQRRHQHAAASSLQGLSRWVAEPRRCCFSIHPLMIAVNILFETCARCRRCTDQDPSEFVSHAPLI